MKLPNPARKASDGGLRLLLLLGAVAALVVMLSACGGSSSDGSSEAASTTTEGSETRGEGSSGNYSARLEKLFAGEGYEKPDPKGAAPEPGKNVWVISCDQKVSSCAVPANAAMEAGKKIGWNMTLYDAKLDTTLDAEGIRNAIAAGADGIVTYAIDCPLIKQPLSEANAAGIPVVTAESEQCPKDGYTSVVSYTQGNFAKFLRTDGERVAEAVIANTTKKPSRSSCTRLMFPTSKSPTKASST